MYAAVTKRDTVNKAVFGTDQQLITSMMSSSAWHSALTILCSPLVTSDDAIRLLKKYETDATSEVALLRRLWSPLTSTDVIALLAAVPVQQHVTPNICKIIEIFLCSIPRTVDWSDATELMTAVYNLLQNISEFDWGTDELVVLLRGVTVTLKHGNVLDSNVFDLLRSVQLTGYAKEAKVRIDRFVIYN